MHFREFVERYPLHFVKQGDDPLCEGFATMLKGAGQQIMQLLRRPEVQQKIANSALATMQNKQQQIQQQRQRLGGQATGQQQQVPGQPQEPQDTNTQLGLDALQATLDVAGIEPTVGTVADVSNAVISLGRAGIEKDRRSEHVFNAIISLVSMIPMADVVKLLKARQYTKMAKGVAKVGQTFGKPIQGAARQFKQQRAMNTGMNVASQAGSPQQLMPSPA